MTEYTEHNLWYWILSWFGLRERGVIELQCEDPECEHAHRITIWKKPSENVWDVIQRGVQKEFDKM